MKIRFNQNHKVKQGDGLGPLYEKDKEYSFKGAVELTYARKYIARGLAVEVDGEMKSDQKPDGGRGGRGGRNRKPDAEPLLVERRQNADGHDLFVMKEWPQRTQIATELLSQPLEGMTVDGDKVTVTMKNGMAVYRAETEQPNDPIYRIYELVEQLYEPAPAVNQLPL